MRFPAARTGEYTVPEGTKNIGYYAFSCGNLSKITLSGGIESIGSSAFENCSLLKSITLPDSLKRIGTYAFHWSGLESIAIPDGVEFIDNSAFAGCENLKSVTLPAGLKAVPECCFESCGLLETVVIPDAITEIGANAFDSCSALTEINYGGTRAAWNKMQALPTLPEQVKVYCKDEFKPMDETGLQITTDNVLMEYNGTATDLVIPERVVRIDFRCKNNNYVKRVFIPKNLTVITGGAFEGYNSIEKFVVDAENGNYSSENGLFVQ